MSNIHRRGFASLSVERRKEIASRGGKRAHEIGKAHRWTPAAASQAGLKGAAARKARKAT